METLITADAITSIREVWWDVRPHPDFGTVELRMCDVMATLTEVAALAALAQCLVADLDERLDRGEQFPGAREWVVRQNKWVSWAMSGRSHAMVRAMHANGASSTRVGPCSTTSTC